MSASPSPEHLAALATARQASAKIRRVILVATIDGWSVLGLGGITFLGSLFDVRESIPGLLLSIAMICIGWSQLTASQSLRKLSADSPDILARNQLLLCAAACIYFAWSLFSAITWPSELHEYVVQAGVGDYEKEAYIGWYCFMIFISIIGMGSTALYYHRKRKVVESYIRQTPEWIVQMQRTGDSL